MRVSIVGMVGLAAMAMGSPSNATEELQHHKPVVPAPSATATGVGVGIANSSSKSNAVAISGQGGRGGNSNSSLTVNTPANTTSTSTATIKQEVSGTQTLKNVPTAVAPGLAAAGLETCLGSVSGGGAFVGTGFSFGTTIPDPGCAARLDARTLWSMGLRSAAVARLCIQTDIYRSMPDICTRYAPGVAPAGVVAPVSVLMSTGGSPIELIDGRTGQVRMCDNYNAARQRCMQWQGEPPRHRVAAMNPPKRLRPEPTPAPQPERAKD